MKRHFLGWNRPVLDTAVEFLLQFGRRGRRYLGDDVLDLSDVVIAVPGGRFQRRLEQHLAETAEARELVLLPPRILTIGRLPELLYRAARPFADNFTQLSAWAKAIGDMPKSRLQHLTAKVPETLHDRIELAKILAALHRELAADALDCEAVLSRAARATAAQDDDFPRFDRREIERWETLRDLQHAYLRVLDSLELWDRQTARLVAIEKKECSFEGRIVLLGTVDMNVVVRRMLDQVADRATVLIAAPEALQDAFDDHGCLVVEQWQHPPENLAPDHIRVVEEPTDQAAAVLETLAEWGTRFPAEDIVIGVPDQRVIPYVQQALEQHSLAGRYGVGRPVSRTEPYRILADFAAFISEGKASAFSSLIRYPQIGEYIDRRVESAWLPAVQKLLLDRLPATIPRDWCSDFPVCDVISAVYELRDILAPPEGPATFLPSAWGDRIAAFLAHVYGERSLDENDRQDRRLIAAARALVAAEQEIASIPDAVAEPIDAATFVKWVLEAAAAQPIPEPPMQGAIEMLGWLELPWDDVPAMVVTGMNEGIVPSSVEGDPFLPNRLRAALGLDNNARRLARDAYALAVITHTRSEWRLIAGRRYQDEALLPGRLLFSRDDATAALQAVEYFGETFPKSPYVLFPSSVEDRHWTLPAPRKLKRRFESMRVTAFRDYLADPYWFYLVHVLGLESVARRAEELTGGAFGTLAHSILDRFGREIPDETDTDAIEAYLHAQADKLYHGLFGDNAPATVAVQFEQLKQRLSRFAQWQSRRRRDGWEIVECEFQPPDRGAFLEVDGQKMYLRGRIDRIDRRDDEWVVFDYKTSDDVDPPSRSHRNRSGEWIDLQLPLYRHLLRAHRLFADTENVRVQLGYICLSSDLDAIGEQLADWSDADLASADETARNVVRSIWAEDFELKNPDAFGDWLGYVRP
ncbi:PD-(D/E)XK nuclease family protein [Thermostilla marina]